MILELFCVWEDTSVCADWNYSLDMHLNYLGPVSCFSPSWIPSGRTRGLAVVAWWLDGLMVGNVPCLLEWQAAFFCPQVEGSPVWGGRRGQEASYMRKNISWSTLMLAPDCSFTLKSLPWNEQVSFFLDVPLTAVVFKAEEIEWWSKFVRRTHRYVLILT